MRGIRDQGMKRTVAVAQSLKNFVKTLNVPAIGICDRPLIVKCPAILQAALEFRPVCQIFVRLMLLNP
jgi:hypothetical protein